VGSVGFFVTLGFNESRALRAVSEARACGGEVVLIVRAGSIEPALRAVRTVKDFAKPLNVGVRVLEVDCGDWCEVFRISRVMSEYERVKVVIGGGLRIPQAYTLLATLNMLDRVEEVTVHDHDTGEEVTIPKWVLSLIASPERKGKLRVLAELSTDKPKSKEEVADAVGLSSQTTSKYLSFLTKAGLVKRVMPNKYRLTKLGEKVKKASTGGEGRQ